MVRGTSDPVTLRAVGYKNGQAFTVREATTTIPGNRTAVLHLDLTWLNDGTVSGAQTDTVRSLTTSCSAMNQSPIGGVCQPFTLDSDTLPLYVATDLGSSADTTASVDIDDCFAQSTTVTPSAACTLPVSLTPVNYAVRLPAANGVGWCDGDGCIVPLLNEAKDGWDLESDGLVHLPPKICRDGDEVIITPVTTSCAALSSLHPAHQEYGGTTSDAGMDATMPPPADAGDAAIADASGGGTDAGDAGDAGVDAGAAAPFAQLTRSSIYAVAADATSIYLLEMIPGAGYKVERLPLLFDATSAATGTYELGTLPSATGLESAAAFPYYALSQPSAPGTVFLLAGTSATQTGFGIDAVNLGLTVSGASTNLSYVDIESPYGATQLTFSGARLSSTSTSIDPNARAVASMGAAYYATSGMGGNGPYIDLDVIPGTPSGNPVTDGPNSNGPLKLVPLSSGIAWVDAFGDVEVADPTGGSRGAVSKSPESRMSLAGSGQRIWWIDAQTTEIYGATWDGTTFTDSNTPAGVGAGGAATATGVQQVIVAGTQLVWFDSGGNVYRRTISSLP